MSNLEPDATDSPWEDLVISILAVNQYSLERTYVLLGSLRENKVTDPAHLSRWSEEEIESMLRASGFDRGSFMTKLFAERLSALAEFIRSKGIPQCERAISGKDARTIEAFLLPIKGIGPKVLQNFYSLRDIKAPDKVRG